MKCEQKKLVNCGEAKKQRNNLKKAGTNCEKTPLSHFVAHVNLAKTSFYPACLSGIFILCDIFVAFYAEFCASCALLNL